MTRKNSFIGAPALVGLLVLTVLTVLTTLATPAGAAGQGTVPLFLAIPETFPDVDGRVVLLRESGRDLVLLRRDDATPETLSVALGLLDRLDVRTPRRQGQGQMVPITGYKLSTPIDPERIAELTVVLTELEDRPVARLGNLGLGRSMRFPAQYR